jgi:hypothetical protein
MNIKAKPATTSMERKAKLIFLERGSDLKRLRN